MCTEYYVEMTGNNGLWTVYLFYALVVGIVLALIWRH
jgi:hypothetical protein